MQSDFRSMFQAAQATICVPPLPLPQIRERALARAVPHRRLKAKAVIATIAAGLSIFAVALAADRWGETHLSASPTGGLQVDTNGCDGCKPMLRPNATAIRAAVKQAAFPVTLPAGLPGDVSPTMVWNIGTGALLLAYDLPGAARRSDHLMEIVLTAPRTSARSDADRRLKYHLVLLDRGRRAVARSQRARWRVGGEDVLVLADTVTTAELARMKAAMLAEVRPR